MFVLTVAAVWFENGEVGAFTISGWAGSPDSSETIEMLSKDEFSSTGSMNGVSYTKGHSIYALFLGAEIEQPQQYYVQFNAVGGEVLTDGVSTGEAKVILSGTMDQVTSQDLSRYSAQR